MYLGPSLRRSEAEKLLPGEYRPPVKRGDLTATSPGRLVIIIDGEFDQSLSVSPKEILALLDAGERVLGASSMGALRAAELYPFGMEGFGWVFTSYQSGRIDGDDEVALVYSPIDSEPITIPLVNIRYWLERLEAEGTLGSVIARRLLRRARKIFFKARTFAELQRAFEPILESAGLKGIMRTITDIPDVKAADARLVLSHAASIKIPALRRKEGSL